MGTKTETREITICDVCKNEGNTIHTCLVCQREYCWQCAAPPREGAYFNSHDLCKECAVKPAVKEVQEAYRAVYWALAKKEREAFGALDEARRAAKYKEQRK